MDINHDPFSENTQEKANLFSKLCFIWLIPVFKNIMNIGWTEKDVHEPARNCSADSLGNQLENFWNEEICSAQTQKRKPHIKNALKKMFWNSLLKIYIINFFIFVFFRPLSCLFIQGFINSFSTQNDNSMLQKCITGIMVFITTVSYSTVHPLNCICGETAIRVRTSISALIYRKILRLRTNSVNLSSGKIINMLSSETLRIFEFCVYSQYVVSSLAQLILIIVLMWVFIGGPATIGLIIVVAGNIALQYLFAWIVSKERRKVAAITDQRIKLMTEIVAGIKIIKIYSWEKAFQKSVSAIRKKELKKMFILSIMQHNYYIFIIAKIAIYVSVLGILYFQDNFSASVIFTTSLYIGVVVRTSMVVFFTKGLYNIFDINVVLTRINDFLISEETSSYINNNGPTRTIIFKNILITRTENNFKLFTQTIELGANKLCAIIGPVGSGKTTLLESLLGEVAPKLGTIHVNGVISYCSQEPWLFTSTVRRNILFGQEYDEVKYNKVVNVCNLTPDFTQFPNSDHSLVGERGVIMSGGQKARINLARAVYRDADIYLLDDPLSAVDTVVGNHLFESCILNYLKGKTCLLVTHQLQYLEKVDIIIVIDNNTVQIYNNLEDLRKSNLAISNYLGEANNENTIKNSNIKEVDEDNRLQITSSISAELKDETSPLNTKIFKKYLKAGGNPCAIIWTVFCVISTHVLLAFSDWWLADWSTRDYVEPLNTEFVIREYNNTQYSTTYYVDHSSIIEKSQTDVIIFTILHVLLIAMTILSHIMVVRLYLNASKTLHDNMFNALIKTPLKFFNYYPTGRILSRFSSDMTDLDEILPEALKDFTLIILFCFGAFILLCISNYYLIISASICLLVVVKLQTYSVIIGKKMKYLEVKTISPIFSYINYTFFGLVTIRASQAQDKVKKQYDILLDRYGGAVHCRVVAMFSFAFWIDLLCSALCAFVMITLIIIDMYFIRMGDHVVGLALYQVLLLQGVFQFAVRRFIEIIYCKVSIERIMEYCNLENENKKDKIIRDKFPEKWPLSGKIEFRRVYLKYGFTETTVLNNISFVIKPKEKVGVVGRTGAGKSSLINVIFNLVDFEGSIIIDNINTKRINLEILRKCMSIIPQEPILFSETIRYNLDPFNEFTDNEIWNVLDEVKLKSQVQSLDYLVSESGSNFSTGEKQLICLGRAILRKNKILILDEATANVDQKTDELIQETIKRRCQDYTIITIAHRLHTVMEFDKILVMDKGKLIEYDHPHILLENRGTFYNLVMETGDIMSSYLKKLAQQHYFNMFKDD